MLSAKIACPLLFASALLASQTTLSQALSPPNPAEIKRADTPVPPRHPVFDGLAPAAGHTVATDKTADVPATAAAHTSTIAGELVPYDTPEFDFERATTPEIVKFFVLREFKGRNCGGCCPTYGLALRAMTPEYAQALVQRANTHPKTKVFRALKSKYAIHREDLLARTLVNPHTGAPECPLAAAANIAVERRILADLDRSCCAFKCHVKQPKTSTSTVAAPVI